MSICLCWIVSLRDAPLYSEEQSHSKKSWARGHIHRAGQVSRSSHSLLISVSLNIFANYFQSLRQHRNLFRHVLSPLPINTQKELKWSTELEGYKVYELLYFNCHTLVMIIVTYQDLMTGDTKWWRSISGQIISDLHSTKNSCIRVTLHEGHFPIQGRQSVSEGPIHQDKH